MTKGKPEVTHWLLMKETSFRKSKLFSVKFEMRNLDSNSANHQ